MEKINVIKSDKTGGWKEGWIVLDQEVKQSV